MNQTLYKFSKLKANWNGYRANTFDENYLKKVDIFIKKFNVKPHAIFPLPEGEVQIEYDNGDDYLEIVLYKNCKTMEVYRVNSEIIGITVKHRSWNIKIVNTYLKKFK